MPGVTFVASSRGVFSSSSKTLTFTTPSIASKGDVLVAVITQNAADTINIPAGWTLVVTAGTPDKFLLLARMIDSGDPASFAFPLVSVANEWQAELVVFRGSSPGAIRYAGNISTFTATTALPTPVATVQQAIDLLISVWTCSGAPVLTLPSGFTAIDSFNTSIVSSRSMMLGYKIGGATGTLTFGNATAGTNTTGASITEALRDRLPIKPAALVDIVPGNIGLIGNDTRPAR